MRSKARPTDTVVDVDVFDKSRKVREILSVDDEYANTCFFEFAAAMLEGLFVDLSTPEGAKVMQKDSDAMQYLKVLFMQNECNIYNDMMDCFHDSASFRKACSYKNVGDTTHWLCDADVVAKLKGLIFTKDVRTKAYIEIPEGMKKKLWFMTVGE